MKGIKPCCKKTENYKYFSGGPKTNFSVDKTCKIRERMVGCECKGRIYGIISSYMASYLNIIFEGEGNNGIT